ncbi:unnamed protein product [Rotaria socialis]|uniref:Uncharacterized protein n=1 Tax=Rotaria socialis TaxID=392032 RepID=A0A821SFU1_9BILA|nr:unnamed protein product [Rotaria socialis]
MLEVDFNSKRSGAEVIVALHNESEPAIICKVEIKKDIEFKEESINLNWKEDLSSHSIKTQDNLIIERDREDEISLGVEELLTPSNKVDVGDMRDQMDKITHMELLDPSTEMGVDVTLHGNSLQHEFSKKRKIELDFPSDLVWKMKDSHLYNEDRENENHSQSPKRIESNIESVLLFNIRPNVFVNLGER